MKRMKVTGKELALLCGMAALGTLTFPLGAAARTVDSVTATAGSTAEIVYSGETLTVTAASRSGLGQISLSNQMPVPNGYAEFTSMAVMAAAFRQRPISR